MMISRRPGKEQKPLPGPWRRRPRGRREAMEEAMEEDREEDREDQAIHQCTVA